jgi:flagellar operon protein (TIGR03826 family)
MTDIANCPKCDRLFAKTAIRDVCEACYKEEEKLFETVFQFLKKRENRTGDVDRIVEATGVSSDLIYKWVKKGRLKQAHFPNLTIPCEKCGKQTKTGRLCESCSDNLRSELTQFQKEEDFKKAKVQQATYHRSEKRR